MTTPVVICSVGCVLSPSFSRLSVARLFSVVQQDTCSQTVFFCILQVTTIVGMRSRDMVPAARHDIILNNGNMKNNGVAYLVQLQ
jgi:hypothetical protein